jgi:hypothetical protein
MQNLPPSSSFCRICSRFSRSGDPRPQGGNRTLLGCWFSSHGARFIGFPRLTLNHWRDSAGSTFGAFETNLQSYSGSRTNVGCQTGVEDMSCTTDKNDATNIVELKHKLRGII